MLPHGDVTKVEVTISSLSAFFLFVRNKSDRCILSRNFHIKFIIKYKSKISRWKSRWVYRYNKKSWLPCFLLYVLSYFSPLALIDYTLNRIVSLFSSEWYTKNTDIQQQQQKEKIEKKRKEKKKDVHMMFVFMHAHIYIYVRIKVCLYNCMYV